MGKDIEWKSFFRDNHRYADIINGIGCGGIQRVKDTDLQEVDSGSGRKARDMLRKTAFGANFALIGIENQDEVDYEFPLRNMQYDVHQYQKQANRIRKELQQDHVKLNSGEFMYGFKRDSRLNPIITIVLYSGKEPWDGPACLHDILDSTDIPDGIQNMTPDYPINIIDIRRLDDTNVFKTDVKQAFDVVTKYTNSKELVDVKKYEGEGGIEVGFETGRGETKVENARNLLDILSDDIIAEKIGLSLETVQNLRRESEQQ